MCCASNGRRHLFVPTSDYLWPSVHWPHEGRLTKAASHRVTNVHSLILFSQEMLKTIAVLLAALSLMVRGPSRCHGSRILVEPLGQHGSDSAGAALQRTQPDRAALGKQLVHPGALALLHLCPGGACWRTRRTQASTSTCCTGS